MIERELGSNRILELLGKDGLFFRLAFIMWFSTEILYGTTVSSFFGIPRIIWNQLNAWIVWGILLIQIVFLQTYSRSELVRVLLCTIPIVVSAVLSDNNVLLSAWMFIVAAKEVDFDAIIRMAYKVLIICIPIVLFLYFIGVAPNRELYRNGIVRQSMGFSHPNVLGMRLFQVSGSYLYIRAREIRSIDVLVTIGLAFFSYKFPNSQTSYICIAVLGLLMGINSWIKKRNGSGIKSIYLSMILVALVFNLMSVTLSVIGTSHYRLIEQIDVFLSARISACHKCIENYGISIFGQKVYITEAERSLVGLSRRLYLDNAYVGILLKYGIIVYFLVSILYLLSMYYYYEQKNDCLIVVFFVYALYGVMEPGMYQLTHNIFLMSMASVLYNKEIIIPDSINLKIHKVRFTIKDRAQRARE